MKYTKIVIEITCVLSLLSCIMTGCTQENNASVETELETQGIKIELDTTQSITTENITTDVLSYSRYTEEINLKINNNYIQTIDNISVNADIITEDYDFDGYEDIFISETKDSPRGIYYHFNSNTEQFENWEELNQIGWKIEIQDNHTLLMTCYDYYGSTHTIYEWNNTKLIPKKFIDFYFKSDYEVADYYQYLDSQTKMLYYRELYNINSNTCIKAINYPIYFEIQENAIVIMKNNAVIQTIENINLLKFVRDLEEHLEELKKTRPVEGGIQAPEKYLQTYDYDFDGYDDLFIPTNLSGVGEFYHFNSNTEQFETWEELNQIGIALYPEVSKKLLTAYDSGNSYIYKWDSKMTNLDLIQRKYTYKVQDGNTITEIYQIDEAGNEILTTTESQK